MGISVYSLLWVMQDFDHQHYGQARSSGLKSGVSGRFSEGGGLGYKAANATGSSGVSRDACKDPDTPEFLISAEPSVPARYTLCLPPLSASWL